MSQTATKLFFGSDEEPGIRRLGRRRFHDIDELTGEQVDDADTIARIRSLAVPPEVNDYLRDVTGLEATAKTFRMWSATLLAAAGLAALPAPASVREGRRVVTGMLAMVSSELNNTPAVCRRCYIHPEVVERYLDGNLLHDWAKASARGSRLLSPEERRLLHLLESFTSGTS